MIFFGTLMAAAVVALGEPAKADLALTRSAALSATRMLERHAGGKLPWLEVNANRNGTSLR